LTYFDTKRVYSNSATDRISATGADIIAKWEYIGTPSADMNELGEIIDETDGGHWAREIMLTIRRYKP
jgi:hypothetical protein